jgi:hypothetical protein
MIASITRRQILPRAAAFALPTLGLMLSLIFSLGLAGCASSVSEIGDNMTLAFVDPAKYDYYDCKLLETERKTIATKIQELERLMAKAQTGVGGPVVAELAYRNDYIAYRGQAKVAEEAWRKNKCHDSPPTPDAASATATPTPAAHAKGGHPSPRSGSAVY